MQRYLIHTACPESRKAIANALAGLSGRADEHSIPLKSVDGTDAKQWDTDKGYSGFWYGASQALAPAIAMPMLGDGEAKKTESFYAAFDEASGTLLGHNCPTDPADASFAAFLSAAGLELVEAALIEEARASRLAFPK